MNFKDLFTYFVINKGILKCLSEVQTLDKMEIINYHAIKLIFSFAYTTTNDKDSLAYS